MLRKSEAPSVQPGEMRLTAEDCFVLELLRKDVKLGVPRTALGKHCKQICRMLWNCRSTEGPCRQALIIAAAELVYIDGADRKWERKAKPQGARKRLPLSCTSSPNSVAPAG